MRVYPDACIVIDLVQGERALRQRLNAALNRVSGESPLVAYSDLRGSNAE